MDPTLRVIKVDAEGAPSLPLHLVEHSGDAAAGAVGELPDHDPQ